MSSDSPTAIRYLQRNFDQAAILAVAAKLAFDPEPRFDESELATIAAMHRAHPTAGDTNEELGAWLATMSDDQIDGVINNTKGVLHEMEFVRLENEDGDTVHAALFEGTNHPSFDVQFFDEATGERWEAQLKATSDANYVQSWIDAHPDGEILVSKELADTMQLPTSGIANGELTSRTDDVVDRLIEAGDNDSFWDYFPSLTIVSLALVTWELWKRYRSGNISISRFKTLVARATGLKASKLAALSLAMSIPGLNVVTGAALAASLILSALALAESRAWTSLRLAH